MKGFENNATVSNNVAAKTVDSVAKTLANLADPEEEKKKQKKASKPAKPKASAAPKTGKTVTGSGAASSVPPSLPPTLPPLPPTVPLTHAADFEFQGSSEGFAATNDEVKSQYEENNTNADGEDISYLMNGRQRGNQETTLNPAEENEMKKVYPPDSSLGEEIPRTADEALATFDLENTAMKADNKIDKGIINTENVTGEAARERDKNDMELLGENLEKARVAYAKEDHNKRSAWDKIRSFFGKKDDKEKNAELLKQVAVETDPVKKAELQAQFLTERKNKDADVEYYEAFYLNSLRDYKAGMLADFGKQNLQGTDLDAALGKVAETMVLERDTLASTQNDIKESSLMESYPGKAWGYWLKSAETYKSLPTKKKLLVSAALLAGGWAAGGVGVTAAALAGGGTLLRLLGATGLGAGIAGINKGKLETIANEERTAAGKNEVAAMVNTTEKINAAEKIAEFDKKLNDCVFQADEKLREMQQKSSRITVRSVGVGIAAGTLMYNIRRIADIFGVTDKVHELYGWASDKVHDLYDGAADKVHSLYDGAADMAHALFSSSSGNGHSLIGGAVEHAHNLPNLGENVLEVHNGSNFIDTLENGYLAEHRAEFIQAHPEFSGHTNEHIAFELAERYTETHPDMEGHLPDLIHEGAKLHFNPANLQVEIDDPQGHGWLEPSAEPTSEPTAAPENIPTGEPKNVTGDVSHDDLAKAMSPEDAQVIPDNAEIAQKVDALDAKVEQHFSESVPENSEHDFKTWEGEKGVEKAITELDEQNRDALGELQTASDVDTPKIHDRMDNIKGLRTEAVKMLDQLHADHVVGSDATEIGSLLEKGASSGRILETYLDKLTEASPDKVAFWNEIKNQPFGEVNFGDNMKGVAETIADFQNVVGPEHANEIYPKTDFNGNATEKTGDWLVRIKNLALKLKGN